MLGLALVQSPERDNEMNKLEVRFTDVRIANFWSRPSCLLQSWQVQGRGGEIDYIDESNNSSSSGR